MACTFNLGTLDPHPNPLNPHYQGRYTWSGTLPGNLLGMTVSFFLIDILPSVLGTNPRFYMLVSSWKELKSKLHRSTLTCTS